MLLTSSPKLVLAYIQWQIQLINSGQKVDPKSYPETVRVMWVLNRRQVCIYGLNGIHYGSSEMAGEVMEEMHTPDHSITGPEHS